MSNLKCDWLLDTPNGMALNVKIILLLLVQPHHLPISNHLQASKNTGKRLVMGNSALHRHLYCHKLSKLSQP